MGTGGKKWWRVVESGRTFFPIGDDMFKGEYFHSIDAKGRLIIPQKLREQLGDEFVITRGLDGCLCIYENHAWKDMETKLKALPLTNSNARKFSRFMLAGAVDCEVDKQGRVLLPASLREFASLDKDVALAGVGGRIEIWNKDKWIAATTNEDGDMNDIAESMEGMGI